MQLHLTVGGKLIDSIDINPELRENKKYIEKVKEILCTRNKDMLSERNLTPEYYLDPVTAYAVSSQGS